MSGVRKMYIGTMGRLITYACVLMYTENMPLKMWALTVPVSRHIYECTKGKPSDKKNLKN